MLSVCAPRMELQAMTLEGRKLPICLNEDCTTETLFQRVASAMGCPHSELRISYAGKELTCGPQPFPFKHHIPVLHVVRRMRGGGVEVELARQMKRFVKDPLPGISVGPSDSDALMWYVKLMGPARSPYAGGWFDVELKFPKDFPHTMPTGRFLTKIWHPNVGERGNMCISQERANSSGCAVEVVLVALQMLLSTPNPDSPLNKTCAEQYKKERAAYIEEAAAKTKVYAM